MAPLNVVAIMPLIDFILHIDQHLQLFLHTYGHGFYAIVFTIVFIETGLVFMPFLPGDSLLFACGAMAATGAVDLHILLPGFLFFAILGDNVNYAVGRSLGARWSRQPPRFFRLDYLHSTERYFIRHGGKTVLLARFAPIIRTFTPFVAGAGRMPYPRFFLYDSLGGLAWTAGFVGVGYAFGNIPAVRHEFTLSILLIIAISLLPALWHAWREFKAGRNSPR